MIRRLIFSLACCHWALPHLDHPEDHCALAATCKHDGAEIYGILSDNRTARLFLDICDLYEYNCDHKKDYEPCIQSTTTAPPPKNATGHDVEKRSHVIDEYC